MNSVRQEIMGPIIGEKLTGWSENTDDKGNVYNRYEFSNGSYIEHLVWFTPEDHLLESYKLRIKELEESLKGYRGF